MLRSLITCGAMGIVLTCGVARAELDLIVQRFDEVPDGGAEFNTFLNPSLNNAGQVSFAAGLRALPDLQLAGRGVYMHDQGLIKLAREGEAVPGGDGVFDFLGTPVLNAAGQVAFTASLEDTAGGWFVDDEALYLHDGTALNELARADDPVPEGGGRFELFNAPLVNDGGTLAFRAVLRDTPGGWFVDDEGLYVHDGAGLSNLARTGTAAPGGSELFDSFDSLRLAGNDDIAFRASLRDASNGLPVEQGLYHHDGAALSELVRTGQTQWLEHWHPNEPGDDFTIVALDRLSISDAGSALFHADMGASSSNATRDALFLHDHNGLTLLASELQLVWGENVDPPGFAFFTGLDASAHNAAGRVAVAARVETRVSGGDTTEDQPILFAYHDGQAVELARQGEPTPRGGTFGEFSELAVLPGGQVVFKSIADINEAGIYIADGVDLVELVRTGDVVGDWDQIDHLGGGMHANDHGQVAFGATFAGRPGILTVAPTLNWRAGDDGAWDDAANWTLGLNPAAPHRVAIDPAQATSIDGPAADVTVRSLDVAGDQPGATAVTLTLGAGELTAAEHLHVHIPGRLAGSGSITAPLLVNDGAIELAQAHQVLAISGDYDQGDTAMLHLTVDDEHASQLHVGGHATLAGGLDVTLTQGASITPGSIITILTAEHVAGNFADTDVSLPGAGWALHYGDDSVALSYELLVGDMNRDGTVDTADVAPFVLALTNPTAYMSQHGVSEAGMIALGDINGDGAFDTADVAPFVQLLVAARSNAVPEPGSLTTLALAAMALLRRRQPHARHPAT